MILKVSAHYVFPVCRPPVRHGIVVMDEEGVILEVPDPGEEIREIARTVFFNGVLVPGFIIFLELEGEMLTEQQAGRWGEVLREKGCRAAVMAAGNRTLRMDLFTGEVQEITPEEAAKLRGRMVVIRKKGDAMPDIRDLFPVQEGAGDGRAPFEERLTELTCTGAEALGMERAGCLVPGYRPGVVKVGMEFGKFEARSAANLDVRASPQF